MYFVELTVPRKDAIGVAHERKKHTDIQNWQGRQWSVVRKLKSSQLEVSCRVFVGKSFFSIFLCYLSLVQKGSLEADLKEMLTRNDIVI